MQVATFEPALMNINNVALVGLLLASALVVWGDVLYRRIGNWTSILVLSLSVTAMLSHETELQAHVISLVAVGLISVLLYRLNLIGGGDAKLLLAFSISLPFSMIGEALSIMAISGGAVAIVYLIKYRVFKLFRADGEMGMPYGLAIVLGFYPTVLTHYL